MATALQHVADPDIFIAEFINAADDDQPNTKMNIYGYEGDDDEPCSCGRDDCVACLVRLGEPLPY